MSISKVEQHRKLYGQTIRRCERRLKRQAFIGICKQTVLLPAQLLTAACSSLSRAASAYPRRRLLRAKLKHRIEGLDQRNEPQFVPPLQKRIHAMDRLNGEK